MFCKYISIYFTKKEKYKNINYIVETKINFYFIFFLKLLNKRNLNIYLKCMKIKYPVTALFILFFSKLYIL